MTEMSCNCFVKEDMLASPDVVWRTTVDFSMLERSSCHQNKSRTAHFKSRTRRKPVAHVLVSWVAKRSPRFLVPALSRDDENITKCCYSTSLASKLFVSDFGNVSCIRRKSYIGGTFSIRNQFVEEPWLLQSSLISPCPADLDISNHTDKAADTLKYSHKDVQTPKVFNNKSDFRENETEQLNSSVLDYPVEEPWLFESAFSTTTHNQRNAKDEILNSDVKEERESITENLQHEEESNSVVEKDSISTVILINSSVCTMQRIAVLENGKLVELLLEPVKNIVHCDSVYLGVVTKLVPHMGGAFVNIGSSRPSFMDIKDNREPFILPSFQVHRKGEANKFPQNGTPFHGIEEPVDEVDDELSEEECNDDDLENHENRLHLDVLEVIKENVNGSVTGHASEADQSVVKGGSKWAQVQRGSNIIVQVVKEGLGTKGPTLTAYPKLKSRFWILMTRCKTIGISKKISGVERTRLRVIAKTLQPHGFGVTVRTVASGRTMEELQKDLENLILTWKNILEQATSAALAAEEGVDEAVPVMLHRAMGQTLSVVQDYFNEKVRSLVVDSPRTYHEVTNYLEDMAPNLCERIELYNKKTPLFDEYDIEGEINNILSKRVSLDNGGYLVIEQTEALVSIDVNGGQCMLGQGTSQEKAILEVNLAAAKQIARELRLRDIGGIIVVDFIDMLDDSNKRLVYEQFKSAAELDRSTVKVSELSKNGLMEITRKRVRPSVTFMISEPCTCCHGTGRVEALDTSFSKIEHEICRLLAMSDQKPDPKSWPRFILRVDRHMCNYLTSGRRTRLAVLSSSLKVWILLKVARGLTRGTFDLKPLTGDENFQDAISVFKPAEVVRNSPNKKVTLFPIKKWITGGK